MSFEHFMAGRSLRTDLLRGDVAEPRVADCGPRCAGGTVWRCSSRSSLVRSCLRLRSRCARCTVRRQIRLRRIWSRRRYELALCSLGRQTAGRPYSRAARAARRWRTSRGASGRWRRRSLGTPTRTCRSSSPGSPSSCGCGAAVRPFSEPTPILSALGEGQTAESIEGCYVPEPARAAAAAAALDAAPKGGAGSSTMVDDDMPWDSPGAATADAKNARGGREAEAPPQAEHARAPTSGRRRCSRRPCSRRCPPRPKWRCSRRRRHC